MNTQIYLFHFKSNDVTNHRNTTRRIVMTVDLIRMHFFTKYLVIDVTIVEDKEIITKRTKKEFQLKKNECRSFMKQKILR